MKELKTRIQHKHDTAAKWANVESTFTPLAGELIVYDADDSTEYPKFKFGDGETTLDKLPFVGNDLYEYVLSTFVKLEDNKSLISDSLITKLENISDDATKVGASTTNGNIKIDGTETTVYTHPEYTAKESGFYKVTVDKKGHVSNTTAVTKADITSLGIPSDEKAEENQNAFSYVQVGNVKLEADDKKDTLNIAEGDGIKVTLDSTTDKITIANSGVREVSVGTTQGTIHVDTAGTAVDVAVKGLKSAAFTESSAYATSGHTHNYAGSNSVGGPANSVKSSLKVGDKTYNGSADVTITAADLGLDKAMSFIGSADTGSNIFDGSTTSTIHMNGASVKAEVGDVVLFGGYEYVWTGIQWEQLGQEGSFALKDHNHSAEDITSGTLPITRGGTGATTKGGVLTNLDITATAAELNVLDGITATTTELNYTDGVTSNIQTQLNSKVDKTVYDAHKHSVTATGTVSQPTFTGTAASHNHTFTGTQAGHTHTFTGTEITHDHSFTGAKHKHTFSGTAVTSGEASATESIYQISGVGSLPSHTYTAPSLTASVSNQCLTLSWSAGEHSFNAGSLPTRSAITVAKAHTHSVTAAGTINEVTATGTIVSKSFTPAGTIAETKITPAGTVGDKSITPAGTVSQPIFTGTAVDTGTPK